MIITIFTALHDHDQTYGSLDRPGDRAAHHGCKLPALAPPELYSTNISYYTIYYILCSRLTTPPLPLLPLRGPGRAGRNPLLEGNDQTNVAWQPGKLHRQPGGADLGCNMANI